MKVTSTISRSVEIPLRIFGIWPGTTYTSLYRSIWVIVFVIAQYFQYQYIIKNLYTVDLSNLMDGLGATLSFTLLFIRIVIFWLNQETLNEILTMIATDWKKNSGTDLNITINNAILSHSFSNFMYCFQTMAVILHSTIGLTLGGGITEGTDISKRPLILKMDFPFRIDTQIIYGLMMVAQFFYFYLSSILLGMINVLLIGLVLHVAGQIDILRRWLTEILFSDENGYKPSYIIIQQIIKKHQSIIIFAEHLENLYSRIALILFVSDTAIICFVGFVLVIVVRTSNILLMFKVLAFYSVLNIETFLYCFAGEYLSAKSKMIGEAAYDSRWYASDDRWIIFLLIMRSQNQLTLTIGKFMNLSLERFASIIKLSASYVSVMLAMY